MESKVKTPELEKIRANWDESQKLRDFLKWLQEQELHLCVYDGECEVYYETPSTIEKLLALYFKIDLDKAEKERQALLDTLRKSH